MKTPEIQIHHLQKFLDCGLTVRHQNFHSNYNGNKFGELNGLHPLYANDKEKTKLWHYTTSNNSTRQPLSYCKPLLHSMTDLVKEITYKGKKIIPLVELAKIEDKNFNRKLEFLESKIYQFNNKTVLKYIDNDGLIYYLCYFSVFDSFSFYDSHKNKIEMLYTTKLYRELNLMHFDRDDLIGQNLAIDINNYK